MYQGRESSNQKRVGHKTSPLEKTFRTFEVGDSPTLNLPLCIVVQVSYGMPELDNFSYNISLDGQPSSFSHWNLQTKLQEVPIQKLIIYQLCMLLYDPSLSHMV